jgi:subtilisin-like proprotein convertase family protein
MFGAQSAMAQCTAGAGGNIPTSGSGDGVFQTTLPTFPLVSTIAMGAPGAGQVVSSVKILGATHTWAGDLMIVLDAPDGSRHNILCGMPSDPNCDLGGDYEFKDAIAGSPLFPFVGVPVPSGSYAQNFGGWTSGNLGINNTALESVPAMAGNYTLSIYDWVGGDIGAITGWELCYGSPSTPPPPPPSLVCVAGGTGGAYPLTGAVDGTYPTVLPTGELLSAASITVPAGATAVGGVKLIGWNHTWITDTMVVLEDPSGTDHLIYQNDNGSLCGGCADDVSGDYTFRTTGTAIGCGVGLLPPGDYAQTFGTWPTGSAGVFNTPINTLPLTSGTWTLKVYDWCVAFDSGSLGSWELCFDVPAGPVAYCTAGTSTTGCQPTISGSANLSASFANPCSITASGVDGQKFGILFYSVSGQNSALWCATSTSFLCVKAPTQRTPSQNSGGTAGACDGALTLDVNAYMLANPASVGQPFSAGNIIDWQGWYRDPPACKTTQLTGGLNMTVQP